MLSGKIKVAFQNTFTPFQKCQVSPQPAGVSKVLFLQVFKKNLAAKFKWLLTKIKIFPGYGAWMTRKYKD